MCGLEVRSHRLNRVRNSTYFTKSKRTPCPLNRTASNSPEGLDLSRGLPGEGGGGIVTSKIIEPCITGTLFLSSPCLMLRTCFALHAKCCIHFSWLMKHLLCRLQLLQLWKESLKKFMPVWDSNPQPVWYGCNTLPIELHVTNKLAAGCWIGSL